MEIFKEDARTGVSCGVNDFGEVFCGDDRSGYTLSCNVKMSKEG